MKAEHRKELHTNALADRMGRLMQGVKSGRKPTSIVLWVIILLAVGIVILWYSSGGPNPARSQLWVRLQQDIDQDNPESLADLKKIADENPGTTVGRLAQFQRARRLLGRYGVENLYSPDRAKAITNLQEARQLYEKLAQELNDYPVLRQEALLKIAIAEEALTGVPKAEGSPEKLGSLDNALEDYRRYLAGADKDSPLYKTTVQHVASLEKNKGQNAKDFYAELNRIADIEAKNRTANTAPPKG